MDLQTLLTKAYRHEINIEMKWFWDADVDISIGDDMNGYKIQANVKVENLTQWLFINLKSYFPEIDWTN